MTSFDSALARALLALVAFAAAGSTARAGAALPDDFRRVLETGAANGAYGCIEVGLIDGKDTGTWRFGCPAPADDAVPAFEIGAVTDVFTGVLLARAVLDGKLRLGDEAPAPWRGASAGAASDRGAPTLSALATQTSGLPATPPNLFPATLADPYASYRRADLADLLVRWRAPATTTTTPSYSPLNAAVLGLLLSDAYGASSYARLLEEKVLVPLGMLHTGTDDAAGLLAGTALGRPAPHWHYDALTAAAGLRSTLPDLLAFVRANLAPEASPLRAPLLLARQARVSTPDGDTGLGWHIHEVTADEQTWPLVWRASVTGGFSAFVGFRTDQQKGLVILSTAASEVGSFGLALLSGRFAPDAPPPPPAPGAAAADRYSGLYRLLDGGDVVVRGGGDALTAQLRGLPPWALVAIGDDVYAAGPSVTITFVRNVDTISGLLLAENGTYVSAQRLSARAPRLQRAASAGAHADLADYAGDYALDDLLQLRVVPAGDRLLAQFTASAPLEMRAYAPDRFCDADGANELIFRRDDHGAIAGLTVELAGGERAATALPPRAADARTNGTAP